MRIFVSYAAEDRPAAEPLALLLRGEGHSVFFDRDDLPPGEAFDAQIRRAIEQSDLFLFLITPRAVAAGKYTLTELAIARRRWPHPAGRVLPVLLAPTNLDDVPAYLRAVTILEPAGNIAADVADEVALLARRRRRRRLIAAVVVLAVIASAIGAMLLRLSRQAKREVRVDVTAVERWKKGQSWEGDRYLARLEVRNGFDVPVEVSAIEAEAQSGKAKLETTFEVSGAAYLDVSGPKSTSWSIVLRWLRQDGTPLQDGAVPSGVPWRVCWSAVSRRDCSAWKPWSPRGAFEPLRVAELSAALRKQIRAVTWTGKRFVLALATGRVVAVDPSFDLARARETRIPGTPVTIDARGGGVAIGTLQPDGVTVVDEETLAQRWSIRTPAGSVTELGETKPRSTEPLSIAFDGNAVAMVTSPDSGVPSFYRLEASGATRSNPIDDHDLRYLHVRFAHGALYGTTPSLTPRYIYRLPWGDRAGLATYSGHDVDDVSCIADFAEAEGGTFLALGCQFRLQRFHFDGPRFVLDERLNAPPNFDPAMWDTRAISAGGGIVTAGLTRFNEHYEPVESKLVQRDAAGVWRELLAVPKMRVEKLAGNGALTLALLSDGKGNYDTFALKP